MKVRRITKEEGKRVNISRFPNFHKSGSIRGMKKQYYGVAALLVRCGSYIYNVTSEPNIYYNAKYIAKFIPTCNTLLIISYVLFYAAFIRCRGVYLRHRSQEIKRLHK